MKFMENVNQRFDICVASGILYHMTEPARFLELCAKTSDKIFIWTHYADDDVIKNHTGLSQKIKSVDATEYKDYKYNEYYYEYDSALGWAGFCGGSNPFCKWITKSAMIQILKLNGFNKVEIFFDDLSNHPAGPNICFLAER